MTRAWSILGAILLMAGCGGPGGQIPGGQIPEATPEMAMAMGVEQSLLNSGRESYLTHCSQCHERILPGNLDPEYWRSIVPHMAEKSDLTEGEESDLLIYLMAAHGTVHGENLQH